MTIHPAAFFEPCSDCGLHGRFRTAHGRKSQEVFSKEYARTAIDIGLRSGEFREDEVGILRQQVNRSDLPLEASPLDSIEALAELFNPSCNPAEARDRHENVH